MVAETQSFRWTAAERRAWKPRPRLKPSEWAEKYRRLPRSQSARPGRWRNDNAPYLRGMMDIPLKPGVSEVVIMKAAQLGGSEAMRNLMGCLSDQDPDPMGIALPDQTKGRKIVGERIIPFYTKTPVLEEKLTGVAADIQKGQLKLSDHTIHLMWAGSAASMSSDPMRVAFLDEIDKFKDWVGREADAWSLVRKRTRTYEDRARQIGISTPTTASGKISQLFQAATHKLYFYVPCHHCHVYQRLVFPQIKWPKPDGLEGEALADAIKAGDLAWYECSHCKGEIRESMKPEMVRAGRWQTEDGSITDAESVDLFPPGTRIGFQIAAWYALWVSFSEVAYEWIRASGKLDETFAFWTQTAGEPFEQRIKKTSSTAYAEKSKSAALPEGVIPKWAVRLIGTIDTQHDHFWLVIRAWGPGLKSQRVFHSRIATFDELARLCWQTPWRVDDNAFPPKVCDLVLIDSGGTKLEGEESSRTMQVYQWCQHVQNRAWPIKGAAQPKSGSVYVWDGEAGVKFPGQRREQKMVLWYLATHHWNDMLQHLIDDDGDPEKGILPKWNLNTSDDAEYNSHMSGVHKVARRSRGRLVEEWVPVTAGTRIDYRDCEVYQVAGAHILKVEMLPPDEEIERMRKAQEEQLAKVKTAKPKASRDPWAVRSLGNHL